jgi:restriction endonuclease S subunit
MAGRNVKFVTTIPGRCALSVNDAGMPTPKGWAWTLLSDVARLESGHTPSRSHPEYWDGDIAWIGIKDAREHHGCVVNDTSQHVTQAGIDNSAARLLPAKTVCLSRTASVGYVVVMGRPMATSQDFVNWICSPAIDPDYLKWIFLAEGEEGLRKFGKGTTHTTIYFPEVEAFHVALAPLNEQCRIVAKLDAIFEQSRAAKARLEHLPALLEKLKRSILAAAFRGDLTADWRAQNPDVEPADKLLERFRAERRTWKAKYQKPSASGDSDLPDLPAGWCWTTIGTVGDILNGRQRAEPKPGEATRPYLRIANIKDDEVAFDDVNDMAADPDTNAKYSLLPGDILVSAGQSLEKIGQSAMFLPGMPDVGFQKNIFRFRPSKTKITPEYAQLAFRTFVRTGVFLRRSSITTNLAYLTTTKFAECPFPLAPEREQLALVQLAKQLLGTIKAVEDRIVRLVGRAEALDQSILVKAFRGELAAQDPNDEPAGVLLERIRAARAAEHERPRRGRGQRTAHTKVSEVTTVASNGHAATGQHDESLDLVVGVFQINRQLTTTAIAAATGLDDSAVTKALKILVDGGQVRVHGRSRGTTYEWSP